ncbi:MAG: hypothetical protein UT24_C0034G0017 [Candidatus Woesebacteria bacterium GW2011_GWB1_39_12]|uniref:Uncharacterized protein n=1 Tax=Candidatus Woesebacteria bacterium GW2011_GWB1_39_12 TaxID=1618574 RepID=A0A0G0PL33_9BACT|nr:MAG: hypothetical protein UT24_C0034G0017 [Candidatus Woesebacteria bacterium GW2011_GWB1_39_12]
MKKLITSFTKLVPVFPSLTKGLDGTKTFKELKLLAKAARRFQEQMIDIETVSKTKAEEWNKQNPPLKGEEENFAEKSISRQKSMGDFIEAQKNFHDEELIFELSEEELKAVQSAVDGYKPSKDITPQFLINISEFLEDIEEAIK